MKNLKIDVPKGYEIDKDKSTFDNIVFKKICELPSIWDNSYDGYTQTEALNWSQLGFRFPYKTKEQAEASIALAKLSQLRYVYRQGWAPDWSTRTQSKWSIFISGKESFEVVFHTQACFLSFQDEETAELFLENFRDLIEKAKPLMS